MSEIFAIKLIILSFPLIRLAFDPISWIYSWIVSLYDIRDRPVISLPDNEIYRSRTPMNIGQSLKRVHENRTPSALYDDPCLLESWRFEPSFPSSHLSRSPPLTRRLFGRWECVRIFWIAFSDCIYDWRMEKGKYFLKIISGLWKTWSWMQG